VQVTGWTRCETCAYGHNGCVIGPGVRKSSRADAVCRPASRSDGFSWCGVASLGILASKRAVSSAVEHCFHTAGVTGSIPVPPTKTTGSAPGTSDQKRRVATDRFRIADHTIRPVRLDLCPCRLSIRGQLGYFSGVFEARVDGVQRCIDDGWIHALAKEGGRRLQKREVSDGNDHYHEVKYSRKGQTSR
jgi:hypothetical protein